MKVFETERLSIRWLTTGDTAVILKLVNEPAWLQFIGDRGVHTPADAQRYLINGPIAMYARCRFGLFAVERRADAQFIGICGLLKRDTLDDVDLGFAFFEKFWGQGFATEATSATMAHAQHALLLKRVVALTSPDNQRSIRLLEKLGFKFERRIRLTGTSSESKVFAWSAADLPSETTP